MKNDEIKSYCKLCLEKIPYKINRLYCEDCKIIAHKKSRRKYNKKYNQSERAKNYYKQRRNAIKILIKNNYAEYHKLLKEKN